MAEQYVHERRLAGTVFTEKREDFAALQVDIDAVVGDIRAKRDGDVLQSEDILTGPGINRSRTNLSAGGYQGGFEHGFTLGLAQEDCQPT